MPGLKLQPVSSVCVCLHSKILLSLYSLVLNQGTDIHIMVFHGFVSFGNREAESSLLQFVHSCTLKTDYIENKLRETTLLRLPLSLREKIPSEGTVMTS